MPLMRTPAHFTVDREASGPLNLGRFQPKFPPEPSQVAHRHRRSGIVPLLRWAPVQKLFGREPGSVRP